MSKADLDRSMLARPATEGAHQIAGQLLDRAQEAHTRFEAGTDPEALHDFRVAVRRLRSWLSVYAACFDPDVARAALTAARALGRATREARDLEVQMAWLELQQPTLGEHDRAALRLWHSELESLVERSNERARRHSRRPYQALQAALQPALNPREPRHPPKSRAEPSMARASKDALRATGDRLGALLVAAIDAHAEATALHGARIQGKVVRYLLEPVAPFTKEGERALRTLKQLQDLLGELNDLCALRPRLRAELERAVLARLGSHLDAPGAIAPQARARHRVRLLWRLERRRSKRRAKLAEQLDAELGAGLGRDLSELFRCIAQELETIGDDAPMEIERRYLLSQMPSLPDDHEELALEQGWLPGEAPRTRLRRTRCGTEEHFERTLKVGTGLARIEVQEEIPREEFERLWPLTEGCRIRKTRFRVPDRHLCWEIDAYASIELMVAEVELPTTTTEVAFPDWLRPFVRCEVTEDPRFTSMSLAMHGVPQPP